MDDEQFLEAQRQELAGRERERLGRVTQCPMCGRSGPGAEWDLLNFAQAMNAALRQVRFLAEAADGTVPSAHILRALTEPYRFPLSDGQVRSEIIGYRIGKDIYDPADVEIICRAPRPGESGGHEH